MKLVRFARNCHKVTEAWAEVKQMFPEVPKGWKARHNKLWWVWELPEPEKKRKPKR